MLCSPIYKYLRKKIKRNILIVGTKNSGKTALLYRLVLNKFITYRPALVADRAREARFRLEDCHGRGIDAWDTLVARSAILEAVIRLTEDRREALYARLANSALCATDGS